MKKETYEKHISYLERENQEMGITIDRLREKIKSVEKETLIKHGETLKRVVLFLNTVYGRLGEVQGSILNELNALNNENLITTSKRMAEALELVKQMIPHTSLKDGE